MKAAELAIAGDFQKMVALRGTAVIGVPIAEGVQERKKVDADLYAVAELFAK